jgi:hypothetical protein
LKIASEKVEAMSKGPNEEGLTFETSEDVEVLPFDALGLKDLLCGAYAYGFERPSAVQQRAEMSSSNLRVEQERRVCSAWEPC